MGSDMLAILESDSDFASAILKDVPNWFEDWEQSLSRFRLDSELTLLNRTFDQPVAVSETLWDVYQIALWANNFSGGLVTPTVLDALLTSGYDRPFDDLSHNQFSGLLSSVTEVQPLSLVVADPETRTIALPKGVQLDFGGIAKGWSAHQTVDRLRKYGPCLVNAGGDIAVSGPRRDGSAWEVGISDPFHKGTDFDTLHITEGGVATSGKDRRNWRRNGVLQHHIINPNTGQPVETDALRVTVVAPTVMEAEAAAKTVFILGREKGLEWLKANPTYAGMMILETGEVFINRSMPEFLQGVMHATSK